MKRSLAILSVILSGGLLSCDTTPEPTETPKPSEEHAERAESALAEARAAEADRYAPASYREAEEALRADDLEGAESRARLAAEEANAVRSEAREAAAQLIRRADILLRVVEAIVSHDPPNRYALPDDAGLQAMRVKLEEAGTAFDSGDYVTAGLVAQAITEELTGASRTTT